MEQMKNTSMVEAKDVLDSFSSSSSFSSCTSFASESDSSEEVTISPASSCSDHRPLLDMSSLFQQLPIKRGLSKHYQGKSQSFTSLGNVRSVEDLAKPENPYNNKKLKCCRKSYGGGFMGETEAQSERARQFCKSSRGSCSSNLGIASSSRPPMPMPPHISATSATAISNQTPLFA